MQSDQVPCCLLYLACSRMAKLQSLIGCMNEQAYHKQLNAANIYLIGPTEESAAVVWDGNNLNAIT